MLQNGEISQILPIDSAWVGSSVSIEPWRSVTDAASPVSDSTVGFFVLGIVVVLLVFGRQILQCIPKIFNYLFFSREYDKINEDKSALRVLYLLFFVSCPVFAALLFRYKFISFGIIDGLSPVQLYLVTLAAIYLCFIIRRILLFCVDRTTGYKNLFIFFNKILMAFMVACVVLSLLPLPFTFIGGNPDYYTVRIVLYSLIGLLSVLYLFYVGKIIISKGVSLFFCFLYLCTFEILPLSLIVGTLIKF